MVSISPPKKNGKQPLILGITMGGGGGIFGYLLQVATCRCPKARCNGLMEASKQKINLRVPPNPNFANETLEAEEPENLWYDIPRYYKVVKKIFILQLQHSIWYIVQNYSPLRPTQQVFCPEYCQLNTMPLDQGKNERNHTNFTCQSSLLPIKNQIKLPKTLTSIVLPPHGHSHAVVLRQRPLL